MNTLHKSWRDQSSINDVEALTTKIESVVCGAVYSRRGCMTCPK